MKATFRLKNSKAGKTALILGNGPSLDKLNPKKISKEVDDIFVVNNFYKLQIASGIRPTYYVLSDPTSFFSVGQMSMDNKELVDYLESIGCNLILPHHVSENFLPMNTKIYFDDRDNFLFNRNIDPTKPRGYISVTLYKAIAMACYLGYSRIYILGLDNTEFYGYEGAADNRLMFNSTSYAQSNPAKERDREKLVAAYNGLTYEYSIAGRMQAYAYLFGDLELFPKTIIRMLDQYSLIDTFVKETDHPLIVH